jgi:flagellar biosynthesis protein FliR
MVVSEALLLGWLQQYGWPFLRVSAVFMILPVFGTRRVPTRVRLILSGLITVIVVPLLPAAEPLATGSGAWVETLLQQMLIGLAIGFTLLLVFESVLLGSELIAYSMGLGFAQLADPLRGVNTPVVGQFLTIWVTLLFLSLDGAAWISSLLVTSFELRPIGGEALSLGQAWALLQFAGSIYAGGVQLALPIVIALLWINLTLGVISRSAPALNLFAIGFPVTLFAGLLLLWLGLPSIGEHFGNALMEALVWIRDWLAA